MCRYVDAVFPGQYGVPKKPWFFLQASYWCGTNRKAVDFDAPTPAAPAANARGDRGPTGCVKECS